MWEVVLDTETTGLDPQAGHRLVEIGAVELLHHVPTGRSFHRYINPEREMPEDAFRVHGLAGEVLRNQPVFADIADEFLEFIGDSRLIIHNAPFDISFFNMELARAGRPALSQGRALDTLAMAQRKWPGASVSLDALCRRFGVDASARTRHGALLDSELLAEVYLHLIGGRQADLGLIMPATVVAAQSARVRQPRPARHFAPSPAELIAHTAFLERMKSPLWNE